ncbi:hypothetical protein [Aeromonas phage 4_4512]|nr:hypothetical protein [Aeromonas phage 4_4512]
MIVAVFISIFSIGLFVGAYVTRHVVAAESAKMKAVMEMDAFRKRWFAENQK